MNKPDISTFIAFFILIPSMVFSSLGWVCHVIVASISAVFSWKRVKYKETISNLTLIYFKPFESLWK